MVEAEEEEVCDLSVVLAPLSKDQLEILIVKLIGRNEEIGDDVRITQQDLEEIWSTLACDVMHTTPQSST